MNKKILIGSIIAVVILVLVSFTGVVGYQTTKSSTIAKASPLFKVRTNRALGEDSKDIACDYVGKEKPTLVTIPKRINKLEIVQKVLDIISKTDDKTFKVYLNLIINQMQKNDKYDDVNINEVITAIHQLRDNSDRINLNVYKNSDISWRDDFVPTYCWFPGCYVYSILLEILYYILLIPIWIITNFICSPSYLFCYQL